MLKPAKWAVIFAVFAALAPGAARGRRGTPARRTFNTAAVSDPSRQPDLMPGAKGTAVLRAQILLDRSHFSVGQIDANLGSNTETALEGFRAARQLPQGPGLDQAVWNALNMDQAEVLTSYTITADDLKGPFVIRPHDMMAQAKLPYLGYASPLDELAERFHIAPALLQRLNPGKTFRRAGERLIVPNVGTGITGSAARIEVSKSKNTVTAFDDESRVLAQYPCSSGSEYDPLPLGEWKIVGVSRNPKFHYNPSLFWDAKAQDSKATIAPGPRNPVGVVWIDLSKEHYGIHGTPDPALIGRTQSHGCIRLTNWDAAQLVGLVKPGTPASLVG